ncbi:hypothetical protein Hanom_Chr07g00623841 [Helianthus anomalus]
MGMIFIPLLFSSWLIFLTKFQSLNQTLMSSTHEQYQILHHNINFSQIYHHFSSVHHIFIKPIYHLQG